MKITCEVCGASDIEKDVIALNKKPFNRDVKKFYCLSCMAEVLGATEEDLLDKIEEFKDEGCKLFD